MAMDELEFAFYSRISNVSYGSPAFYFMEDHWLHLFYSSILYDIHIYRWEIIFADLYLFLSADPSCFCWMDRNNDKLFVAVYSWTCCFLFVYETCQSSWLKRSTISYIRCYWYMQQTVNLFPVCFYWRFCYSLFMITYFIIDADWSKIERLSSGLFCYRSQESLMYWSAQGIKIELQKRLHSGCLIMHNYHFSGNCSFVLYQRFNILLLFQIWSFYC